MPKAVGEDSLDGSRELLELDIKEVSLVDKPANKRQFVVIKRLEGKDMTTPTNHEGEVKEQLQEDVVAEAEVEEVAKTEEVNAAPVEVAEVQPETDDTTDTEVVTKARRMTKGRLQQLRESLSILGNLLKDLDPDVIQGDVAKAEEAEEAEEAVELTLEQTLTQILDAKLAPLVAEVETLKNANEGRIEAEKAEIEKAEEEQKVEEAAAATEMDDVLKRLAALEGVPQSGAQNDSNVEVTKANSLWQGII